jgi:hypothetical protein
MIDGKRKENEITQLTEENSLFYSAGDELLQDRESFLFSLLKISRSVNQVYKFPAEIKQTCHRIKHRCL